jgi:cytochrome c-type biogenesis protein CcmH/NrfF
VETYGDSVLATPKKSGLELSIWTLPVVAAIFGTAVIYTYAKKKAPIPDSEVDSKVLDPGYSKKKRKKGKDSKSTEHYDNLLRKEYKKQKKKRR